MGVGDEVVDVLVKPRKVLDRRGVQHLDVPGCAVSYRLKSMVDGVDVGNDVEVEVVVNGVEKKRLGNGA